MILQRQAAGKFEETGENAHLGPETAANPEQHVVILRACPLITTASARQTRYSVLRGK